jgi:hypothetical protein
VWSSGSNSLSKGVDPATTEHPLSEEWVFLDGDGGRWWLLLAKDRALAATAHRDLIPNPQLLLIVMLKLKIMPGLRG